MDYDATTIHHSRKKKSIRKNNSNENISDAMKLKKIMHRDMERQRRKGMAVLHSSLLPLNYLKVLKHQINQLLLLSIIPSIYFYFSLY